MFSVVCDVVLWFGVFVVCVVCVVMVRVCGVAVFVWYGLRGLYCCMLFCCGVVGFVCLWCLLFVLVVVFVRGVCCVLCYVFVVVVCCVRLLCGVLL